jgi:hypothetical protein
MHVRDGLHIEKLPDGYIKVGIYVDGLGLAVAIPSDEWISVIAEMSGATDPALAIQRAREFHKASFCPCTIPQTDHCCDRTYHQGCIVYCSCEAPSHPQWAKRSSYQMVACRNDFHATSEEARSA